jgi:predicted ribosome quality control (RQC) complex YloA/Tae2 family protein
VHNNYYFFKQLTRSLEKILINTVISECFSQNKDELIIRFETPGDPFFIKASLQPSFSCLSFPDNFHRARRNSIDLFEILIGHRVQGIRQFENERSFALQLNHDLTLLFKMHGNRANILLFSQDTVIAMFRNNLPSDTALKLDSLDRSIDWNYEAFVRQRTSLQSLYFTFGKLVWKYLAAEGFSSKPLDEQWQYIQQLIVRLEQPRFYIVELDGHLHLSLLPAGKILKEFSDPVKAINEFFYAYTHEFAFRQEKSSALSTLRARLHSSENYFRKTFQKLEEVESDTNYKTWADLIMANLHELKTGMETVTLPSFYHPGQQVDIKLKKDLSPQRNAEVFYRKAKNQHIEIQRLQQSLEGKDKEIEKLKNDIGRLEAADGLKKIRTLVEEIGLNVEKEKQAGPLPYHEFEYHGFRIWVGKNAQGNDELTQKYGYKEDLWLHAKDVPGSHVLIKYQSGKKFPKDVIERAAQLAAYNSKRKNETLCPVVFTPRKFVRKRKGDPAGMVVVEREEVVLVEPKLNS